MAIYKCKMCGGTLEISEESTVYECEYCGSRQTVPTADDEKKMTLFSRANRLLASCEFDKAAGVFESIAADYPEEAEAFWGIILCRYGIEYVDDPASARKIPTCHRSSFDSIFEDADFDMVLENADPVSRSVYRDEAKEIERIRSSIVEVSSKEDPYDIFICYKETDSLGERTIDSVIAQDVYDALTEKGYRVFFARISLEDKLGQEYEPYIFAALNSAKIMLAFGTDYEYFNAVWVKNEWSRYLALMAKGEKKSLIPCYRDIDAYDMPKEFAKLQSQDMGKVGAVQDLLRGIDKILKPEEQKPSVDVVGVQAAMPTAAYEPLLKRGFMFCEEENWESADEYFEKALDMNPECAEAYLGKLMADLHVTAERDLEKGAEPFTDNQYYQKILRFGDETIKSRIAGYDNAIQERMASELAKEIADKKYAEDLWAQLLEMVAGGKSTAEILEDAIEEKEILARNNRNRIEELETLKSEYPKLSDDMRVLEQKLADVAKQKESLEAELSSQISELNSLGLFAGSKKVEIRTEIEKCETKINKLDEETDNIQMNIDDLIEKMCHFDSADSIQNEIQRLQEEFAEEEIRLDEKIKKLKEKADAEASSGRLSLEEIIATITNNATMSEYIRKNKSGTALSIEISTALDFHRVFGQYPQTGTGDVQPIVWTVLEKTDDKALLISDKALDCKPYNNKYEDVTWATCSLRKWLNDDFLNAAFSKEEQKLINTTEVSADKNPDYSTNPGKATSDKVFLLSIKEVEKYFDSAEERMCVPTEYVVAEGLYTNSDYTKDGKETCCWWLRSPGDLQNCAAYVLIDGNVSSRGILVNVDDFGVRPALWVNF